MSAGFKLWTVSLFTICSFFLPQTVILNHMVNTETLRSSEKYASAKQHSIIFCNLYFHGPVRSVTLSVCVSWRCLSSKNEWLIEVYHGLINSTASLSYMAAYALLFLIWTNMSLDAKLFLPWNWVVHDSLYSRQTDFSGIFSNQSRHWLFWVFGSWHI